MRGQLAADAGHPDAKREYAGKVEADREQNVDHHRHEERRLQLKSPADFCACSAQPNQRACDQCKADQNTGRISHALQPHLARRGSGVLHQAKCLDCEDRKNARHQVEDQAAGECQQQRADETDICLRGQRRRSEWRRNRDCLRRFTGLRGEITEDKNAIEDRGRRLRGVTQKANHEAFGVRRNHLGCVVINYLRIRGEKHYVVELG